MPGPQLMQTGAAKQTYADLLQPWVRPKESKRKSLSYRVEPNIFTLEMVSILSPVLLYYSGVCGHGYLQRWGSMCCPVKLAVIRKHMQDKPIYSHSLALDLDSGTLFRFLNVAPAPKLKSFLGIHFPLSLWVIWSLWYLKLFLCSSTTFQPVPQKHCWNHSEGACKFFAIKLWERSSRHC